MHHIDRDYYLKCQACKRGHARQLTKWKLVVAAMCLAFVLGAFVSVAL